MHMNIESLLSEAEENGIEIVEHKFKSTRLKALYLDKVITINTAYAATEIEKKCILAEELGHYHTSYGNILDQNNTIAVKQEKSARNWAYEKLVPLTSLIDAFNTGVRNRHELSEYLGVTEEFIEMAVKHYQEKYGLYKTIDNYIIYFEPLGVLKQFAVVDDK